MAPGAPKIIPLHSSLKPRIWAASREELCRILPEYAQTQDDIVFENRETPTLFVDGAVWPEDRWDGGKTIDLSMVRVFRRRLPDLSPPYPEGDMLNAQYGLIMGAPGGPVAPEAIPAVVEHEDGMFRFVSEGPSHGTGGHSSHSNGHPTPTPPQPAYDGPPTATLTALAPRDAPPEIEALLGSQIAGVPVSLVLCRSAALTPFALPEGCGCAFLGFFFITDVRVQVDDVSWEVLSDDPPITLVNGRKTWRFRLEWTPGGEGEDADTTNSTLPVPWWMEASAPSLPSARQIIEIEPLLHPYTLLPLHLLSPPEQIVCSDADVQAPRGWHCLSCGKLNLQQNLCYQKCDCCSASNGLSPLSVEYVRQPRGTDPIAFPWDRHPESVPCTSTEGRDGLRIFSYVLGAAVAVHHVFTCNRPGPQSEPTELFRALQADTELISELGAKGRGGGGIGPYYGCKFTGASGRQAAAGVWSPDAPDSVRRARDLMRLRGRVDPASVDSDVVINTLTICAWRTAGNKKGCVFSAERSPVVLLCLGADVEVTFWRRATVATKGVQPAQVVSAPVRGITPRSKLAEKTPAGDSDDEYIDEPDTISAPVRRSRSSSKSLSGSAKNKRLEEALMVTLVHGDLLVVHGANFEYSMKRTGMSIVLFGQQ
ncbi:hypothetical protein C8Q78DRAFT_1077739 [Trametes maxima]|nr:hypothetical protein C8Q78DRAFT_1077739 [Trametes maxima]